MEAMEGYMLTDALNPRELSELAGLDYEVVRLLYTAYAAEYDQYGQILSGLEEYEVPLFDMLLYLKEQMEVHNIKFSGEDQEAVDELFDLLISILSAFFVIVVLLFTFQSAGLPVLLILVIQGSIWINFSIPTITGEPLYFLGYLIVNAIMMGANIDYAIVITSHYQELKAHMPHKEAIVQALNASFPTVFTSGTILASAGMLIGNLSAQPVVSIMGSCLGRGTIISMFLVLFVLPAFLVLGDSIINRTSFKLKGLEPRARAATGTVRVKGHVRGYVSGVVDADIDGIIHGQLNVSVSTDGQISEEGGEENA